MGNRHRTMTLSHTYTLRTRKKKKKRIETTTRSKWTRMKGYGINKISSTRVTGETKKILLSVNCYILFAIGHLIFKFVYIDKWPECSPYLPWLSPPLPHSALPLYFAVIVCVCWMNMFQAEASDDIQLTHNNGCLLPTFWRHSLLNPSEAIFFDYVLLSATIY